MNDQQQSRADALTDEHIATLKLAARAVTPQDIDGAERIESRPDGSYITCPACEGEGCIPFESDYCNYDHVAIGVQFYGVGTEPGAAEAYFRAAKPATILALLDRLERAESALAAPPVEQPAAAPADDEQRIEAMARAMNIETDGHDRYWTWFVPSAGAALRALRELQPAPSPADERAAELQCEHQWTWADGKCADCGAATQQPTPTTCMTLAERISHVGGRVTGDGCIEFGSAMALDALIQHVLRDARATSANETGAEGPAIELLRKFMEYRDSDYVPNVLFDCARTIIDNAMAAAAPADERASGMPDEVRDSMMDSQYLAGVTAGWNAANADDPNAALKKIHDAYSGYLNPLRDWQKAGRPGAPATPAMADERAECIAWANANGFPKYHESMCAA